MIKQYDIVTAWERRVGPGSAHIERPDKEALFNWYASSVQGLRLKNKKVADYGIGGGYFFEWLTNNYPIQSYVGYEIADRQINAFKERAQKCQFMNYKIVKMNPYDIPDLNPKKDIDILFVVALLQHVPDQEYYNYLLDKLNGTKIKQIVISFKYSDKTVFREEPYKTTHDIGNACYTNKEDIAKHLTNYKINGKFTNTNSFVCFNLKKTLEEEAQVHIQ